MQNKMLSAETELEYLTGNDSAKSLKLSDGAKMRRIFIPDDYKFYVILDIVHLESQQHHYSQLMIFFPHISPDTEQLSSVLPALMRLGEVASET